MPLASDAILCQGSDTYHIFQIFDIKKMKSEIYDLESEKIEIPLAEDYADCLKLIKSDRFRVVGREESSLSVIVHSLKPFGTASLLFWFRLCQYRGFLFPLCRLMYKILSVNANVDIPYKTKVGYGFYIGHGICMVINGGTIIGNNVNLSQFLNIGKNHNSPAKIGNNVYVGPMVSIVEDVVVGSNSTIGAGAVVTRNIPKNSTAVGVPAKVINCNTPGKYIANPFPVV